ncbi:transcriptional repressor, putative [Phanerochaete sordida]|uniref:Transcriptional repressor, putative n=1 Tax=Phanerochaete sordida TaxID=48140 RepID=A0A9P3G1L0_9APHY|nr:transcriptional repressor, putative [Phanerochaete sordida]
MRTDHPPKCPHPSCGGKAFKSQNGLRAHMKLHEQAEVEDAIAVDSDADSDSNEPPIKKRRGGEIGRDWKCDIDGCTKDFKSKKALTNHRNVNHLGRRDFICHHESCGRAFGYKHLLQRHLSKIHKAATTDEDISADDSEAGGAAREPLRPQGVRVDDITGMSYVKRAQKQMLSLRSLCCPFPDLTGLAPGAIQATGSGRRCEYVFTRAYDFRRHLSSEHGLNVEKEDVHAWVQSAKEARQSL